MTTPKLRNKKADDDDTSSGQKTREQIRINFSDEVKSEPTDHGYSSEQDRDDASDWNLQSGSRNYSTRGKNQDYDYDEDDQEDENQFVEQGLKTAERDRDYDSEVESPHHGADRTSLLDQYASKDLRTDLDGQKKSVPQGRSQPNQK